MKHSSFALVSRALILEPDLKEVARVRHMLRSLAEEAGFADERVFDITVACSEATANAIEHAPVKGSVEVTALLYPDALEVQIEGPGEFQTPDRLGARHSRGLGLPLMAKLSDHLALYSGPKGRTFVSLTFNRFEPGEDQGEREAARPSSTRDALDSLTLSDLIDAPAIQSFLDDFHELSQVPLAIIDLEGRVLVGAGWSDICTRFHRVNPESCSHCIESDIHLSDGVPEGEFKLYKCRNNMWDLATPILVEGKHLGNIFSGQFFFEDETPDRELFLAQAGQYGFSEEEYLQALDAVPRLRRSTVDTAMAFFAKLARMLSQLGYSAISLNHSVAEREALARSLGSANDELEADARALQATKSELKAQNEKISAGVARLNRAQEIAHLGSWELDLNRDQLTWSDEVYRIFGLEPQEFVATYEAFLERVHPEDRTAVDLAYSGSISEGRDSYEVEHRVVRARTGEIRHVHEKCDHIRDAEGRVVLSVGMVHDITERKRAEDALQESEERFRTMADSIPQLAWIIDGDGSVEWYNRRWYDYTGSTLAQMRESGWQDVRDPETHTEFSKRWERSRAEGESFEIEMRLRGRDGIFRPFLVKVVPVLDERGGVLRWLGTATDISEGVQLRAALSRELETSRLLLQTANAIAEWTDLGKILDALLIGVVRGTSHSRASVGLWDEMNRRVDVLASAGDDPVAPGAFRLEEFSPPFQQAIKDGQAVLVDHDLIAPELRRMADRYESRKALLAPLVYRERVVGLLFVDDPCQSVDFTREDRALIEGMASQAAVAVANAQLYEAQRNIADTLQSALLELPKDVSGVQFSHLYRSATKDAAVGGDFYDVIALDGGELALLIGDVAGHGVRAARVATFVRNTINVFAGKGADAEEVLVETNKALLRKGVPGFTSVLLALLDPPCGRLRFCSAGHPNLLLARAEGEVLRVGELYAPPLGVFPVWSGGVDEIDVLPGDVLLLYTDGVTEARANGEMYTEQRLRESLQRNRTVRVGDIPTRILSDVLDFTGGVLQDDAAILTVARTQC